MEFKDKFKNVTQSNGTKTSASASQAVRTTMKEPASDDYKRKFALNSYDENDNPVASHQQGSPARHFMR